MAENGKWRKILELTHRVLYRGGRSGLSREISQARCVLKREKAALSSIDSERSPSYERPAFDSEHGVDGA